MTIPADVLRRADELARLWDRSRSWVIAEAIRRVDRPAEAGSMMVSESAAPSYTAEAAAEARLRHLRHDLSLTPAERLRRAEALVTMARKVRKRPKRAQIIGFDSFEDFAAWKKARRAGA